MPLLCLPRRAAGASLPRLASLLALSLATAGSLLAGDASAQVDPAAPPPAPPADPAAPPAAAPPADPAAPAAPPPGAPAQPPPGDPTAPTAPPPATDPAAPPPAAPPPAPPAPAAATPSSDQADDVTETDEGGEKRQPGAAWVRWRGSAINWSHDVTTTALGVGRDNIGSEGEIYSQGFGATFNFFVIDERDFRLRLTTALGFDVELTDAGDTTTRNEPRFRDIPLTIATGGLVPLRSEDEMWSLGFIPNYTTIFPTSPVSQDRGVYLTMSPRLLTFFTAPILGKDADHLQGVFGGVSLRYDRTFTRATTPTNNSLARPRMDPSGQTFLSDQISGNRLADNALRIGGFLFFEEKFGPSTLWISGGPSVAINFLPEFDDVECVETATGCVEVDSDPNAPSTRMNAGFGASVSFFPMAEWGVDVGYSNNTLQLGEDGQRRSIFYSPDATFNATLIVSVDAIYERIVSEPRKDPVIIFGKNTPQTAPAPVDPNAPAGPAMPATPATATGVPIPAFL